jgi:hypothetical protein
VRERKKFVGAGCLKAQKMDKRWMRVEGQVEEEAIAKGKTGR